MNINYTIVIFGKQRGAFELHKVGIIRISSAKEIAISFPKSRDGCYQWQVDDPL
jgi:hypothetical protein